MMLRISILRRLHRLNVAAPYAALAALAASAVLLHRHVTAPEVLAARNAEIVKAFDAIPYRLGPWLGSDVPLPAGATEILAASAVVSRRFDELGTSRRAILGLVHCGDVRDMLGHYPPNCYPSSGYMPCEQDHEPVVVRIAGAARDAMLYRFRRVDRDGMQREVTIIGVFVLPGTGFTADMRAVRAGASDRRVSEKGIGQLQVVMDGLVERDEAIAVAEDLVGRLPPGVIAVLVEDVEGGRASVAPSEFGSENGLTRAATRGSGATQ